MKFRLLSDLHLEFHKGQGLAWLEELGLSSSLPLLLAGDLCTAEQLATVLPALCRLNQGPVFYVPGNHEYYGSSISEVNAHLEELAAGIPNLNLLLNRVGHLEGRRLLGTTLWFGQDAAARRYEGGLADFRLIEGFRKEVYAENKKALDFLQAELREGDLVLTHHLPTLKSVSDRFVGSPYNAFFVCDAEALILERRPALWAHGHTHDSKDYWLGSTRILCNPYGYHKAELNPDFEAQKLAEIGAP